MRIDSGCATPGLKERYQLIWIMEALRGGKIKIIALHIQQSGKADGKNTMPGMLIIMLRRSSIYTAGLVHVPLSEVYKVSRLGGKRFFFKII